MTKKGVRERKRGPQEHWGRQLYMPRWLWLCWKDEKSARMEKENKILQNLVKYNEIASYKRNLCLFCHKCGFLFDLFILNVSTK